MTKKIEVIVQYSSGEFVRAMLFSQSKSAFYKYNYLILCVSVLIGFVAVNYLINQGENNGDLKSFSKILIAMMIGIPVVYLLKDFTPTSENFFKKQYLSTTFLQETYKISIDADGINSESNSIASKLPWNAIIEAVQTDADFHFFISRNASLFIPKRVFTDEQQNETKYLAKIKLGEKAKF